MGYALSARGIFAPAQKCRMYHSRSTFPQGAALGYGQHLGLQPAPISYRAFVQISSFTTDLCRRLGIVQVNLASALALHKRSFYLPTNFTNFRASEHRAEFIRNLPSAAENIELVKIRATYKVAII